jgi:hypothetical protein
LGRAYCGGVERGERNIAALNLIRIAATMGVEPGQLFPPIKATQPAGAGLQDLIFDFAPLLQQP